MLLQLYLVFAKIGFLSFGGGYPMMGIIYSEASIAVGLTAAEFADMAALELLASGPIAINAATYVGFIKAGVAGAFFATAGVCTPAFVLTSILYFFLTRFQENRYVQGFLAAIKIACGGVLLATVFTLGKDILLLGGWAQIIAEPAVYVQWVGVAIALVCAAAIYFAKASPILMILLSGVAGAILLS